MKSSGVDGERRFVRWGTFLFKINFFFLGNYLATVVMGNFACYFLSRDYSSVSTMKLDGVEGRGSGGRRPRSVSPAKRNRGL